MTAEVFDVAVIGGGVVGCAVARELSGYQLSVALLEAKDDVGDGTSKANTAILHTGFDATPGTLESRLVPRGYQLLSSYAAERGHSGRAHRRGPRRVDRRGAGRLPGLRDKASRNGYQRCELIGAAGCLRDGPDARRRVPSAG